MTKSQCESQNASIIYTKTNNFIESTDTPSFRPNSALTSPKPENTAYKREFENIEGNINEVLGAIQERRQKLRNDSLERKKLIEEVLSRKKELCQFSSSKVSSPTATESAWAWKEPERLEKPESEITGRFKTQGKSYLNQSQSQHQYQPASPKEFSYPQYQTLTQTLTQTPQPPQRRDPLAFEGYGYPSHFKAEPVEQFSSYASPYKGCSPSRVTGYEPVNPPSWRERSRPSTPSASSQISYDINDILKKYNQNKELRQEEESNTLKQLCKSKSGFISGSTTAGYGYNKFSAKYNEKYNETEPYDPRWQGREEYSFSSKHRASSKENVMKRAEE
jgi:hypothetical protein